MAKKIVRGVTGVDDIESFDKSLTNVNDLISDGQNTYVHTKKGKTESYYNLTDNVKKVQSSGETIKVETGENGTVKLSTNPQKVLEHGNLLTDYGISKTSTGDKTTLAINPTRVNEGFNLNSFYSGYIIGVGLLNAPSNDSYFVSALGTESGSCVQLAVKRINKQSQPNSIFIRTRIYGEDWGLWREQVGDKSVIDALLANKQDVLYSSISIAVTDGRWLRQLYTNKQTYSHTNGILKTHVKSISSNTSVTTPEEEFNFIVKINKGATSATFTLNANNVKKFTNIMTTYGQNNSVSISGCDFTLSGSTLTVTTANNVNNNYVITFSDII